MTQQPGWGDPQQGQPGPVQPGQPPYQQPGYGQPSYGQPNYAQPPQYGPVYVAPAQQTNTLAIIALVLAFVVAPGGLVCGLIARKQIRETGEAGDGLALAGAIVGGVITGFWVLYVVFIIVVAIISISASA